MANNTVTVNGMLGAANTYFADNPVIITVGGLEFPPDSPIKVVRIHVLDSNSNGKVKGKFQSEAAGTAPFSIDFDISSALRALWAEETFAGEVEAAQSALGGTTGQYTRTVKPYWLNIFTEYIYDGVFTTTQCHITEAQQDIYDIPGGKCIIGGRTEWERYQITNDTQRSVASLEHKSPRNGDASTKPTSMPEIVGQGSITSWVDVNADGTKSIFYPSNAMPENDDVIGQQRGWTGHAPIVVRDTEDYVDFLFVNRRGAVETCSAQMREALNIPVETRQSTRVETPTYRPSRTIMAKATGGRRSWAMSSGYQTREWAEWWTLEFLMASRHWMRYPLGAEGGSFVPVTVEPAKKSIGIYDHTKQELPHVEFTVTLALEG